MNRILFEPAEVDQANGRATFGGVRAEHVRTILHGTAGQTLRTGIVGGKIGDATIEEVTSVTVTVRCVHDRDPLPPWCDLVLAPPRPRVMKRLLPQLATLGVRRIFLVGAEKVEKAFWGAQMLKPEIYHPLLVEGLMQGAVSTQPPEIVQVRNFARWMTGGAFETAFAGQSRRIFAHPYPTDGETARETADDGLPVFAVGPEGGWTDAEVALLEAHGFRRRSLGPWILKTETATVALLSVFR